MKKLWSLSSRYYYLGWILSLLIHGLIIYWNYQKSDDLDLKSRETTIVSQTKDLKILVDVDLPPDDIDTPSQIIAKETQTGSGKLNFTEDNQQHLPGETTAQAPNIAQNSKSSESYKKKETQSELAIKQQPILDSDQKLAIETENTLKMKFWFDLDDSLRVNTETSPNVPFYLELKDILEQQFQTYVKAGGALNYNYIKKENVSVTAKIDNSGKISFEKMVKTSTNQPYLNYLARQIVNQPEKKISSIPPSLIDQYSEIGMMLQLGFSGHPLKRWWFQFNFFDLNID